jgi:UDP-galactopyranose mutase
VDYDYLIVGCGLFGSTFARLATDSGKKCLIIDKRSHIAGNCYSENIEGINVHMYGPHIFHTSNKTIWDFVNRFAQFNNFILSPKANYKRRLYSLPFNMNTFYEMWGETSPEKVKNIINDQKFKGTPTNLEEQALSLVGKDIYEKLIKGYTEKHWGKSAIDLPTFIIKRLPLRFTFDNNYFNDTYQGIPIGGYSNMFKNMLDKIEVRLNTDYFSNRDYFNFIAKKVVYSGCIDEFFDYEYGTLEYRSLDFKTKILPIENYQGVSQMNFTEKEVPYTRIVEHKHFEKTKSDLTVITKEFSKSCGKNDIPYYPINTTYNQTMLRKYKEKSDQLTNFVFGGRLAEYKYLDMHVVIELAFNKIKNEKLI